MDKFELEQFEHIKELAATLQACFIDDDAYSRTPNVREWRNAGKLVRQITLACYELTGYATAKRCIELQFVRDSLQVTKNENAPSATQSAACVLKETADAGTSAEEEKGFVYFTDKEIEQMPRRIQNLIILNQKRCRIRKHPSGRRSFTYEIRYRRDGYDVSASGVTVELAKQKMIEKLSHAVKREDRTVVPTTFKAFALYYFENFRKEKVAAQTYRKDLQRLNQHLGPHFKETPIKRIMPADCKALYKEIQASGRGKTASEVYSLMSIIFKGAIIHGIIQRSPLDLVLHTPYVSESGSALTKDEERLLFAHVAEEPLRALAFAVVLYTGLRPNELPTARIEGDFIVAKNSKRKNGKIESKKIPIIGKLRPYVGESLPELPSAKSLRLILREVLPTHKLYDLRTTFYTRCDECGVAPPARDEFVGHSSGTLTDTYRDLSDEYLLQEGKKLDLW